MSSPSELLLSKGSGQPEVQQVPTEDQLIAVREEVTSTLAAYNLPDIPTLMVRVPSPSRALQSEMGKLTKSAIEEGFPVDVAKVTQNLIRLFDRARVAIKASFNTHKESLPDGYTLAHFLNPLVINFQRIAGLYGQEVADFFDIYLDREKLILLSSPIIPPEVQVPSNTNAVNDIAADVQPTVAEVVKTGVIAKLENGAVIAKQLGLPQGDSGLPVFHDDDRGSNSDIIVAPIPYLPPPPKSVVDINKATAGFITVPPKPEPAPLEDRRVYIAPQFMPSDSQSAPAASQPLADLEVEDIPDSLTTDEEEDDDKPFSIKHLRPSRSVLRAFRLGQIQTPIPSAETEQSNQTAKVAGPCFVNMGVMFATRDKELEISLQDILGCDPNLVSSSSAKYYLSLKSGNGTQASGPNSGRGKNITRETTFDDFKNALNDMFLKLDNNIGTFCRRAVADADFSPDDVVKAYRLLNQFFNVIDESFRGSTIDYSVLRKDFDAMPNMTWLRKLVTTRAFYIAPHAEQSKYVKMSQSAQTSTTGWQFSRMVFDTPYHPDAPKDGTSTETLRHKRKVRSLAGKAVVALALSTGFVAGGRGVERAALQAEDQRATFDFDQTVNERKLLSIATQIPAYELVSNEVNEMSKAEAQKSLASFFTYVQKQQVTPEIITSIQDPEIKTLLETGLLFEPGNRGITDAIAQKFVEYAKKNCPHRLPEIKAFIKKLDKASALYYVNNSGLDGEKPSLDHYEVAYMQELLSPGEKPFGRFSHLEQRYLHDQGVTDEDAVAFGTHFQEELKHLQILRAGEPAGELADVNGSTLHFGDTLSMTLANGDHTTLVRALATLVGLTSTVPTVQTISTPYVPSTFHFIPVPRPVLPVNSPLSPTQGVQIAPDAGTPEPEIKDAGEQGLLDLPSAAPHTIETPDATITYTATTIGDVLGDGEEFSEDEYHVATDEDSMEDDVVIAENGDDAMDDTSIDVDLDDNNNALLARAAEIKKDRRGALSQYGEVCVPGKPGEPLNVERVLNAMIDGYMSQCQDEAQMSAVEKYLKRKGSAAMELVQSLPNGDTYAKLNETSLEMIQALMG